MSFETVTDRQLSELQQMPKRVDNPKALFIEKRGHKQKNYRVMSLNGEEEFAVYVRINNKEPDDFSCVIRWLPNGTTDKLTLARYNGSTHKHVNPIEKTAFVNRCHIHSAKERYIKSKYKSEQYAEETTRYGTCGEALDCLAADYHIAGISSEPMTLFNQ